MPADTPFAVPPMEVTALSGPSDVAAARRAALIAAAAFWADARQHVGPDQVVDTAAAWTSWLTAPGVQLVITAGAVTFAQGDPGKNNPTRSTPAPGGAGTMAVTMTDLQEVTLTVETEDSKGAQTTGDTVTWSESSGGAVVTLTPSADGTSCLVTAVAVGTSTVTATDGTITGTEVITIDASATSQLVLTPGTVSDQPSGA